ncbi:MAG: aminopeptidase P family protein, partial [Candidatus Korarchaeota archaeon]|nr:aminopeptidase P family protein [Candidatus Korarchaeota archaeon]NIU84081.1 aminopeptidase P family protein [Candidatus Thorarchaeota archaeon]NIW14220.1 aminopeptidase P family protein [Candidatus Thorarchaeota archaeon]NIW52317.1 aminopeptidase P family protein [Candidatus Korarchaeota archaeon]
MQKKGLSAYILPNTDPHLSEYKAEHWQIIKWLSGFTGAGGQLVVTQEKVGLWVGGTESLQAEKELQGTPIK